jgi:hypothetical protein
MDSILAYFHRACRVASPRAAVLWIVVGGLPAHSIDEQGPSDHMDGVSRTLRRAKAHLWHGSARLTLHIIEDLTWDILQGATA